MAYRTYGNDEVDRLVNRYEGRIRRRFREIMAALAAAAPIALLERLIREGRSAEALNLAQRAATALAAEMSTAYIASGRDVGRWLDNAFRIVFAFDGTNPRAVNWMRRNTFRFVQGFTREQIEATRDALIRGISAGANPKEMARAIRESIGLTRSQVAAVNHFREMLESNSARALTRQLRDKRFDRSIRQAIDSGRPLTQRQIDLMVARYQERTLNYRAQTIGRTEALNAVHAGNEEAFQQGIDSGDLDPDELIREWNTAKDERVRSSHDHMHGQKRRWGEPFESGLGNALRYPGDAQAPAEDTVECRCAVGTRVRVDLPVRVA